MYSRLFEPVKVLGLNVSFGTFITKLDTHKARNKNPSDSYKEGKVSQAFKDYASRNNKKEDF